MITCESKRVMCFGDSNTWGYEASTAKRFSPQTRWTGVMQLALGEGYDVIEEGLNGRTTVWEDPIEPHRKGSAQLRSCLESQMPLDLVIIMLGSNDLKRRFSAAARDIALGLGALGKIVLQSETGRDGAPKLLLVSPIHLEEARDAWRREEFAPDGPERSRMIWQYVREVAAGLGVPCFNAADVAKADARDGLHICEQDLPKLGRALAHEAQKILELSPAG